MGLGPENQFLRCPEQEFLNRKVRPAGRTQEKRRGEIRAVGPN